MKIDIKIFSATFDSNRFSSYGFIFVLLSVKAYLDTYLCFKRFFRTLLRHEQILFNTVKRIVNTYGRNCVPRSYLKLFSTSRYCQCAKTIDDAIVGQLYIPTFYLQGFNIVVLD